MSWCVIAQFLVRSMCSVNVSVCVTFYRKKKHRNSTTQPEAQPIPPHKKRTYLFMIDLSISRFIDDWSSTLAISLQNHSIALSERKNKKKMLWRVPQNKTEKNQFHSNEKCVFQFLWKIKCNQWTWPMKIEL